MISIKSFINIFKYKQLTNDTRFDKFKSLKEFQFVTIYLIGNKSTNCYYIYHDINIKGKMCTFLNPSLSDSLRSFGVLDPKRRSFYSNLVRIKGMVTYWNPFRHLKLKRCDI